MGEGEWEYRYLRLLDILKNARELFSDDVHDGYERRGSEGRRSRDKIRKVFCQEIDDEVRKIQPDDMREAIRAAVKIGPVTDPFGDTRPGFKVTMPEGWFARAVARVKGWFR